MEVQNAKPKASTPQKASPPLILEHRITKDGEVEYKVSWNGDDVNASKVVSWEKHSTLSENPALDVYHDEKGCCRPKGKKRKAAQPLSAGDDMDYITNKNKGNCSVCLESRSDEEDPIVYCESCNYGVHASCYGYPLSEKIPEGEWICEKCRMGAKDERCVLCPMKTGMMKRTTDGKWAHLACAMWVPEVYFRNGMGMEAIDTFQVNQRRWMNMCSICKIPQGACLECSHDGCTNKFHLTCGLRRRCHLNYEETRSGPCVYSFCPYHASFWRETQERREARLAKSKKHKVV